MIKYRLRQSNGRVLGPFTIDQLEDLSRSGQLLNIEDCQEYPTGDWKSFRQMSLYEELKKIENQISHKKAEETFVIDLSEFRKSQIEDVMPELPKEALTETIRIVTPKINQEIIPPKPIQYEPLPESTQTEMKSKAESGFEYKEEEKNVDRTIINSKAQREIEELRKKEQYDALVKARQEIEKKKKEELEEQARKLAEQLAEEEKNKPKDEATQLISLDNEKTSLIIMSENAEKLIYKDLVLQEKLKDEDVFENSEGVSSEQTNTKPQVNKRKKLVVGIIVALLLVLMMMPDDDQEEIQFKYIAPQIVFPIPFDVADKNKSQAEFERGIKLFAQGVYPATLKAGVHFKNAYEQDITNYKALGFMLRSYAEELRFSKDIGKDSLTIFNIVLSKKSYLQQDINGVIGLNYFYRSIGKVSAANSVIEKYLKLSTRTVTQDLFGVYIQTLIQVGNMEKARELNRALSKTPQKNKYSYEGLIEYALTNEEIDLANEYLNEAIKRYPQSVGFYLTKAKLDYKNSKYKEATQALKTVEKLGLENNDVYRAIFLELSGLLAAKQNKNEIALLFLKKSLILHESDELRLKIAEISANNTKTESLKMVDQGRAIKFLISAKQFYDSRNYELALSNAAKATEAFPGHIPSALFLAKVQLKLGQVNQSISTLERLLEKYPEAKNIQFQLIQTYIDTYKINDARTKLAQIPANTINTSPEFSSLMGKLYLKRNDPLQAISWLKQAINLNPLSDKDIFSLADLFLRKASFKSAKELINKCIELDPSNLDYRIAYSKIIYETEDDQAAVGYLLSLLEEFKDDPKLLSEIAIFYYRAGKIKDFDLYKKKIEDLPYKDKSLYEFLIRSALLDERYSEIPGYVEELLKIEPSDLESMMTAGKVLFDENKFEEASKWFLRVQEKMSTYPKVLYYVSKIRFLAKEYDLALGEIQKDIKINGENDESLVLLSQIYLHKDDIVQAENMLKKAQKINPKSYDAMIGLADISVKRNNLDLALDLYNRAIKQRPGESIIHKKLGDVYRLLGQGTLAIESYKMYLELEPDSPDKDKIDSYIQLMQ